jgi:uncharacterized Ntn-hydrolase superfamily protein
VDTVSGALGVASGGSDELESRCIPTGVSGARLIASQGAAPLDLGQGATSLLPGDVDPRDLLPSLLSSQGELDQRQILIVDARGRTAAHSGRNCRRFFAHTEGTDHVAAGDNLPSPNVVGSMSLSFERSGGDPLWERLMFALESGARAGGDRDGTRSALLVVYTDGPQPFLDLHVDDHEDPVAELRRLLAEAVGTM